MEKIEIKMYENQNQKELAMCTHDLHLGSKLQDVKSDFFSLLKLMGKDWNKPFMEEQDPVMCFKRSLATCL